MSGDQFDDDSVTDAVTGKDDADGVHDHGEPVDTGVFAEVPGDQRVDVDGGPGSDALEGGDDREAAEEAFAHTISRGGGATVDVESTAVRPYPFPSYESAHECSGAPSSGAGALLAWMQANQQPPGRSMGIYNCRSVRGSSTRSLHSEGRALDWGVPLGADGKGTDHGHDLVDVLGSHAHLLGVQCIIYDRMLWSARTPEGRRYDGESPHFDHLHIELSRDSAADLTLARIIEVLGGSDQAPAWIGRPTVRDGDRGPTVRLLQESLSDAGHDPGDIDGIFGGNTAMALRKFQEERGLNPDAIAGSQTWAALENASPSTDPDDNNGEVQVDTDTIDSGDPDELHDEDDARRDTDMADIDPATNWEDVAAEERFRHVMNRLVDAYGYPEEGAAGIVGNLWAESSILPNRVEGSQSGTPLRANDFAGDVVDFTPEQVRDRDRSAERGPQRPGVGLAQWTSAERRAGLFTHDHDGVVHGAVILFRMNAQVDYLVHELGTSYRSVDDILRATGVNVDDAADEVVYRFEIPGRVLHRVDGKVRRRPRSDAQVQEVFTDRRRHARRALAIHRGEDA